MASSSDSTSHTVHADSAEWPAHEHVAETAKAQAQRLVEDLGSVGLAKQAIDAVGEAVTNITNEEKLATLAKSLGFASPEVLRQASKPEPSNDGHQWFTTELTDCRWAAWNDLHYTSDRQFTSYEEAVASIPRADQLSGTSLLG